MSYKYIYGIICYDKIDDVSALSIFGFNIYARIGMAKSIFGFTFGLGKNG